MAYNLNLTRHRLPNGVTLLMSRNTRLPLISLNAFLLAGSDQNPPGRAGLAELTSRLLDEGGRRYSNRRISRMIEDEGAALSIFSARELTGIGFQARRESLDVGLDVLFELVAHPIFPSNPFHREKRRLLSDLMAFEDEPQSVAGRLLNSSIYQGTPLEFPFLGTVKNVVSIEREDVVNYHRRQYGPQNLYIVAVGDIPLAQFEERAARIFGSWTNPDWNRSEITHPSRQTKPVFKTAELQVEQVQIALGHLGVTRLNPDYHALQVLDMVLGSGPGLTSRIQRVLRDELGLAYLTYGNISSSAGIYPGRFIAFISTSPENKDQALDRLRREIEEVITGRFSKDELQTAKDFLTGNFVFGFESNYNVARFLLTTELFGLGIDYPDRYPELIRGISRQEVRRAASRYLDPINCTTVVVGPGDGDLERSRPTSLERN